MTPDELYAHSMGVRLDKPFEVHEPKAAATPPMSPCWMDRLMDDVTVGAGNSVAMSEATFRMIVSANHQFNEQNEQLTRENNALRRQLHRPTPGWLFWSWLALSLVAVAGWLR